MFCTIFLCGKLINLLFAFTSGSSAVQPSEDQKWGEILLINPKEKQINTRVFTLKKQETTAHSIIFALTTLQRYLWRNFVCLSILASVLVWVLVMQSNKIVPAEICIMCYLVMEWGGNLIFSEIGIMHEYKVRLNWYIVHLYFCMDDFHIKKKIFRSSYTKSFVYWIRASKKTKEWPRSLFCILQQNSKLKLNIKRVGIIGLWNMHLWVERITLQYLQTEQNMLKTFSLDKG